MRLVDLDPRWSRTEEGREGMGITFECPHCHDPTRPSDAGTTFLGVWFVNPIDGGTPAPQNSEHDRPSITHPDPRWTRTGEIFEMLSISPSIDCSAHGHWHGFVTNGEVM